MQKRPKSKSKLHSAVNQGGPGKQSDMLRCPTSLPANPPVEQQPYDHLGPLRANEIECDSRRVRAFECDP